MTRSMIALVFPLLCPTTVFGTMMYQVTSDGRSSMAFQDLLPGQDTLRLEVRLTVDHYGVFGFGGALLGPEGLTITGRTYGSPIASPSTKWIIVNKDAVYLNRPLSDALDFMAYNDEIDNNLPIGETVVVSLVVSGISSLSSGRYEFQVGSSSDIMSGAWWSDTGDTTPVDVNIPFILTPEPATLSLLVLGGLGILRRRGR